MFNTIKLKNTTNCNACRARRLHDNGDVSCILGFKNKAIPFQLGRAIVPLTKCYKPRTFNQLREAEAMIEKENGPRLFKTRFYTFGIVHEHKIGDQKFNCDTVVMIRAENPRAKMFELFKKKWAFEYCAIPSIDKKKPVIDCSNLTRGGE